MDNAIYIATGLAFMGAIYGLFWLIEGRPSFGDFAVQTLLAILICYVAWLVGRGIHMVVLS